MASELNLFEENYDLCMNSGSWVAQVLAMALRMLIGGICPTSNSGYGVVGVRGLAK
ncbi:MAG: hypothetical protein RI897_119 [Verrucomicrobiota bacterium]|jgi:hypothetical protein